LDFHRRKVSKDGNIDVKKMIWNRLCGLRRSELLGIETHEP